MVEIEHKVIKAYALKNAVFTLRKFLTEFSGVQLQRGLK